MSCIISYDPDQARQGGAGKGRFESYFQQEKANQGGRIPVLFPFWLFIDFILPLWYNVENKMGESDTMENSAQAWWRRPCS